MRRSSENYRIYEAIHPVSVSGRTVEDYMDTLGITLEFFDGKTILDCGFGGVGWALELYLSGKSTKVYGIDINRNWVDVMEDRFKDYGDRLNLQNGQLLNLPYDDNFFDCVHCHGVLHHVQNWESGLKELCRVVKSEGTL